jgi:hypothetical protein
MTSGAPRKNLSWARVLSFSALWVAVAACLTAYLIYKNSEAIVIVTMLGNICLPAAAGLLHRSARVAFVVAAMEASVYGVWFVWTLAGVSPR